jgi:hypothetical protein
MRKTILNDNTLSVHLQEYERDNKSYTDAVREVFDNTEYMRSVSAPNKGRVLAVLLHKLDKFTFRNISFDLPEVLLACQILDARRELKQIAKKNGQIEANLIDAPKKKAGKLRRLRKHLNDRKTKLETLYEGVPNLSLTSSKISLVREWVNTKTEDELTYRALMFHRAPWRELADLCHFNPKDFKCDWFLKYCFDGKAPQDSVLYKIKNGNAQEVARLYETNPIPYEYLRLNKHLLNNFMKQAVASKENLRTVLWYADEIGHPEIIASRIESNEDVDLPYGKLVDLLSATKNQRLEDALVHMAENKLGKYKLSLPSPVAVLGDASSSMQVAIRTSGIVASLLCAMSNAELSLFRTHNEYIDNPPRTVREALRFGREMRATAATSPAASLIPYLNNRKQMKTFIIVTDEEENTSANSRDQAWSNNQRVGPGYFAHTFRRYINEVYPASLIFITFTDRPNNDGDMVTTLKKVLSPAQFEKHVLVYKFSKRAPDLRRLDVVLANMAEIKDDGIPIIETKEEVVASVTQHAVPGSGDGDTVTISKTLLNELYKEALRGRIPSSMIQQPLAQRSTQQQIIGQAPAASPGGCYQQ